MTLRTAGEATRPEASVVCDDPWLANVTRLHEQVLEMRDSLRAALKDDSPRSERRVLLAVHALINDWLCSGDQRLRSHTMEQYQQDIFCALVYLMSFTQVDDQVTVVPLAPALPGVPQTEGRQLPEQRAPNASVAESPYVSDAERRSCLGTLLSLAFDPNTRPFRVTQALYPLLIGSVSAGGRWETGRGFVNKSLREAVAAETEGSADPLGRSSSTSQSSISDGLFQSKRFSQKKQEIVAILNGVLLTSGDGGGGGGGGGLFALIRVLLFDDRIGDGATVEAAVHIARLVCHPITDAWVPMVVTGVDPPSLTITRRKIAYETQVRAVCDQLVALAGLQGDNLGEPVGPAHRDGAVAAEEPRYVRQLKEAHLLPHETLRDRLHLVIAVLLNHLIKLPADVPHSSRAFKLAYHRLFYTNKYFLTPAFAPLALRRAPDTTTEPFASVETSLVRLCTVAGGSSQGAGSRALLTILELVSGGVMELFGLLPKAPRESALARRLNGLWHTLATGFSKDSEEIAFALLDGCEGKQLAVCLQWEIRNGTGLAECVKLPPDSASHTRQRFHTLLRLVSDTGTPRSIIAAVLRVALTRCQQLIYSPEGKDGGVRDEGVSRARQLLRGLPGAVTGGASSPTLAPMIEFVETLLLTFDGAALFGSNASLASVLAVVRQALSLTAVTWHWGALLLVQLLEEPVAAEPATAHSLHVLCEIQTLLQDDVLQAALAATASCESPSSGTSRTGRLGGFGSSEALEALHCAAKDAVTRSIESAREQLSSVAKGVGPSRDAGGAVAPMQRLMDDAEYHLVTRSRASMAVTLRSLARATDEATVSAGVAGGLERAHAPWPYRAVGERLVHILLRVLAECDDTCAAVSAVQLLATVSVRRLDSPDGAFVSGKLVDCLLFSSVGGQRTAIRGSSPSSPGAVPQGRLSSGADGGDGWRKIIPGVQLPAGSTALEDRLRLRVLDVLLAVCDDDEEVSLTLRHVDDVARERYRLPLVEVLQGLVARASTSLVVKVAAVHFTGHYAVAVFPRVSLQQVCHFCQDVFRLASNATVKSASAAMLATVAASLQHRHSLAAVEDVDVDALVSLATAMSSYYSAPATTSTPIPRAETDRDSVTPDLRADEIVRMHGNEVLNILRAVGRHHFVVPGSASNERRLLP